VTLRRLFATALAAMALACLLLLVPAAHADNQVEFRGCVVSRTDSSITLDTSGDELITIDTTWISPAKLGEALTDDCVTVKALIVDGRFMAESIEAGDE
jgi:hypothetical protein